MANSEQGHDIAYAMFGLRIALMCGVFWAAWTAHGFWWAIAYGLFAEIWLGFRLATYLFN